MSTTPGPCPKCGSAQVRQVGETASPPSRVTKCEGCGHMWMAAIAGRAEGAGQAACPKCGGALRDVSTAGVAARYLRCDGCQHLVIVPPRA